MFLKSSSGEAVPIVWALKYKVGTGGRGRDSEKEAVVKAGSSRE